MPFEKKVCLDKSRLSVISVNSNQSASPKCLLLFRVFVSATEDKFLTVQDFMKTLVMSSTLQVCYSSLSQETEDLYKPPKIGPRILPTFETNGMTLNARAW